MSVYTSSITVRTAGFCAIHNITSAVEDCLRNSSIQEGIVTVFIPGATAGITTIEYESGTVEDLQRVINRIVPETESYNHNERWGDGNGFSHVRAALLGPSESIPFSLNALSLGTWQQIILIDFDNRPRTRDTIVTCMGE